MDHRNKRALLWLGILILIVVIDLVAMTALGTKASMTFQTVAPAGDRRPSPAGAPRHSGTAGDEGR